MQIDDAALEAVKNDVAAILRHRRAHPRVEQLLDLGDDLAVLRPAAGPCAGSDARMIGRPEVKCSMIAPRIAGLRSCHSCSAPLVTVTKSEPKNTPDTPSI